jgi:hypothetical protein
MVGLTNSTEGHQLMKLTSHMLCKMWTSYAAKTWHNHAQLNNPQDLAQKIGSISTRSFVCALCTSMVGLTNGTKVIN